MRKAILFFTAFLALASPLQAQESAEWEPGTCGMFLWLTEFESDPSGNDYRKALFSNALYWGATAFPLFYTSRLSVDLPDEMWRAWSNGASVVKPGDIKNELVRVCGTEENRGILLPHINMLTVYLLGGIPRLKIDAAYEHLSKGGDTRDIPTILVAAEG